MRERMDMIKSVKDYVQMPLLYNHWYVAGTVDEFGREPIARTILEHSVVFYRTEDGELTALQNRCLHRSFPLSESSLQGDELVCRYHGARYSADGKLLRMPCQAITPKRSLKKYPIQEIGVFALIWMGESEPDPSRLPDLAHLECNNFRTIHGDFEVKSSYLLMQENLNDLSHFAYLHNESFGVEEVFLENPMEITRVGQRVACQRTETNKEVILRSLMPPGIAEHLRASGETLTRYDEGITLSPGVFRSHGWTLKDGETDITDETPQYYIMHYLTPVTKTSCRYLFSVSFNHANSEDRFLDELPVFLNRGFSEDVWACEHMQELLTADKRDFKEMNVASDKAGLLSRQVMLEWAEEEYGDALTAT